MPNLAALHPQIVHFVVALIVVGVAFRLASLVVRRSWLPTAAAALIALGTAGQRRGGPLGLDAHGPVERVPGARPAVVDHETWGERARNVFLILLVVEAVAAALAARQHPRAGRLAAHGRGRRRPARRRRALPGAAISAATSSTAMLAASASGPAILRMSTGC